MNPTPKQSGVLEKLPQELHYLIDPVLRYGCRCESDAFAILDRASNQDMEYLRTIANRVLENDHFLRVLEFLKQFQMTKHDECAQLYFFFGLLHYGGLNFD